MDCMGDNASNVEQCSVTDVLDLASFESILLSSDSTKPMEEMCCGSDLCLMCFAEGHLGHVMQRAKRRRVLGDNDHRISATREESQKRELKTTDQSTDTESLDTFVRDRELDSLSPAPIDEEDRVEEVTLKEKAHEFPTEKATTPQIEQLTAATGIDKDAEHCTALKAIVTELVPVDSEVEEMEVVSGAAAQTDTADQVTNAAHIDAFVNTSSAVVEMEVAIEAVPTTPDAAAPVLAPVTAPPATTTPTKKASSCYVAFAYSNEESPALHEMTLGIGRVTRYRSDPDQFLLQFMMMPERPESPLESRYSREPQEADEELLVHRDAIIALQGIKFDRVISDAGQPPWYVLTAAAKNVIEATTLYGVLHGSEKGQK